jgi:hypothetical protein
MDNQVRVRNIKFLMREMKKGTFDLEHPVQRKSNQWSLKEKELLIDSLLNNIVLFPIVFVIDDKIQYVIDGKQRLTVLQEFIDNKFEYGGKTFKELTEDEQDMILSSELTTITYTDCLPTEIFTLFSRYNNGVMLSGDQKLRGESNTHLLDIVKEILSHPFFKKVNFSNKQLLKSEDETVVLQSLMVISDFEFKNFSFKEITRFIQETDVKLFFEYRDKLIYNLDILNGILEDKVYKNLKKIHIPGIITTVKDTEEYKEKIIDFLENYKQKEEYRKYCQGATSQKEMVMGRLEYFKNL